MLYHVHRGADIVRNLCNIRTCSSCLGKISSFTNLFVFKWGAQPPPIVDTHINLILCKICIYDIYIYINRVSLFLEKRSCAIYKYKYKYIYMYLEPVSPRSKHSRVILGALRWWYVWSGLGLPARKWGLCLEVRTVDASEIRRHLGRFTWNMWNILPGRLTAGSPENTGPPRSSENHSTPNPHQVPAVNLGGV